MWATSPPQAVPCLNSPTPRRSGSKPTDQPKTEFVIDKEKAALHGISAETISQTLRIAVGGQDIALLHDPREKEDRLPLSQCGDAKGPHLVYRKETIRASVSEIDSKIWQVLPNLRQADLA